MIIYLRFSNNLVGACISDDLYMKEVNLNDYSSTSTPVFCVEEPLEYIGGIYEYAYCAAWAFCETEFENTDKTIGIILKNVDEDSAYICECFPQYRVDVYNAFKSKKQIYNGMTYISCKFATFNLPYGVYEMFIYVVENEFDYGLISTGQYYQKTTNDFVSINMDAEISNTSEDLLAEEVSVELEIFIEQDENYHIDNILETDDRIVIQGWASYSEATNNYQKIYVGITYEDGKTKFFTTQKVNRADLATFFNNVSYAKCGFTTTIEKELDNKACFISLIAEIDERYYPIVFNCKEVTTSEVVTDN